MRVPTLLVLFLAGSIPAIGATPQLQPNPTTAVISEQPEMPLSSPELFSRENRSHFSAENWDLEKPVCYKIRSYHMVREDQHSDITHMDGYTTCQPSSKYQTKRTVLDQP
jgi:hypothetical protein